MGGKAIQPPMLATMHIRRRLDLAVLLADLVDAGDGWSAAGGAVRALAVVVPQEG